MLALLDQADDDFDPSPFEIPERMFDHRAFRRAARKFRVSEADQPLSGLPLHGFRFEEIRDRQQFAQMQSDLPGLRPRAFQLIRIRTKYPISLQWCEFQNLRCIAAGLSSLEQAVNRWITAGCHSEIETG
ncbi:MULTISPECIES: hypothetical protein [unclassified Bradyrhizobium]|uniref:hypothetical protein n=1 Tax=unclassified Bradyrhizobium TaxID=2631580 RepID=UPI0028E4777E|nr:MULTISPECIES: hypothetical protein [unclassified Bradyrhizobium]